MDISRPDYLTTARRALARHYPGAVGAFVAGSITRGEGSPTSDIDVVVLHGDDFEDLHRQSLIEEGWPIEFFVHNTRSLAFYLRSDAERGMCIMPTMVSEGIAIPVETEEMARLRRMAATVIEAGPPPLAPAELEVRRYMITDLADDLAGAGSTASRNAALALLHERIGDLHLRGNGHWSGTGKALVRRLASEDAAFAARYSQAFAAAFADDGFESVLALVDEVLAPFGGRLWAGYRSSAPRDWADD